MADIRYLHEKTILHGPWGISTYYPGWIDVDAYTSFKYRLKDECKCHGRHESSQQVNTEVDGGF